MMLPRRHVLGSAAACVVLGNGRSARSAAAPGRPYRIVMMVPYGWDDACSGFRDYLKEAGVPCDLIVHALAGDRTRMPAILQAIRAQPPDLFYFGGSALALEILGPYDAAEPDRFISGVPAVVNLVTDPVAARLLSPQARPVREITGVVQVAPARAQVRSVAAYRRTERIAAAFNGYDPDAQVAVRQFRDACADAGMWVTEFPLAPNPENPTNVTSLLTVLDVARRYDMEWLYLPPDPWLERTRDALCRRARDLGLLSFATTEPFMAEAGALLGLVCRRVSTGALAGRQAKQILLDGKPASSLPFTRPATFSLLVRMDTAAALKAFPPLSLLRYADVR